MCNKITMRMVDGIELIMMPQHADNSVVFMSTSVIVYA